MKSSGRQKQITCTCMYKIIIHQRFAVQVFAYNKQCGPRLLLVFLALSTGRSNLRHATRMWDFVTKDCEVFLGNKINLPTLLYTL